MGGPLRERPGAVAKRVEKLCLALRIAGLAADIAPELPTIAWPCDWKRRRQDQVGIVVLLGVGVMLQMITAVGLGLCKNRGGAEALAKRHGQSGAIRQRTVRAVMHQDRKPERARADNRNRQDKGERVGPQRNHRYRTENQGPGVS